MPFRTFVLLCLALFAGCGQKQKHEAFSIDGYAPGISFRTLDSLVYAGELRVFNCLPDVTGYRECWVRSPNTHRYIVATIDANDYVLMVTERSDTMYVKKYPAQDGGVTYKVPALRERWSAIRPPSRATNGTATMDRWRSEDGRWSASITLNELDGRAYLDAIDSRDETAAKIYERAREVLLSDSVDMVQTMRRRSAAMVALQRDLARLAAAQAEYVHTVGRYATSPRQLHFISSAHHDVWIQGASHFGWWARVRSQDADDVTCFIWDGEPAVAMGARLRAGTMPLQPFCRSTNAELEAAQPVSLPARRERLLPTPAACPDSLARLRARDAIVMPDSSAMVETSGVYSMSEVRGDRRFGRVVTLWRIGNRWLGTAETWIGEPEPLRGVVEGGFSQSGSDLQFRAVYPDQFVDHFNGVIASDRLEGNYSTSYHTCPGRWVGRDRVVLQKDEQASRQQASGMTVRELVARLAARD